jgi:hypothetical protein
LFALPHSSQITIVRALHRFQHGVQGTIDEHSQCRQGACVAGFVRLVNGFRV